MKPKFFAPLFIVICSLVWMTMLSCMTVAPQGRPAFDIVFYISVIVLIAGMASLVITLLSSKY